MLVGGEGAALAAPCSTVLAFADQADNLAGPLFASSLLPYLVFLYFICQDVNGLSTTAKAGFTTLLSFVLATVIASIVAKTQYSTTLANVDWLHSSAESLLTLTNVINVLGLKLTLEACGRTEGPPLFSSAGSLVPGSGGRGSTESGVSWMPAVAGRRVPVAVAAFGAFLAALAAGQLLAAGEHSAFLFGVGDLPEGVWTLGFTEPANALTIPTWVIHVSSLLEWLVAMGLVWRIGLATGNPRWKGLTWGMIPSHSSGIAACVYHFYYNAPDLQFVVLSQAALTLLGNTTLAFAAWRLALSNGWVFALPWAEAPPAAATAEAAPDDAVAPAAVDSTAGSAAGFAQLALCSVLGSYMIKYGETLLPEALPVGAPGWAAASMIVGFTAFNVWKWNERSQTEGDFSGFI